MKIINLKKEDKALYRPSSKDVAIVEVPGFQFIMIDGAGDPATSKEFQNAIEALYSLSYILKFETKKGVLAIDYGMMPLEILWWADDMSAFTQNRRQEWRWTAMIRQPEFITRRMYDQAVAKVGTKKNPVALNKVRLESYVEGRCAQRLHIGSFEEEAVTIAAVHERIDQEGGTEKGKHHEIYLSDMRKTAPEKWKTIVRQPFG